jgi:hypothetical protein
MSNHVFEILEEAAEAKNRKEKIKVLQDNNCLALRDIVKSAYDDTISFSLLPKGSPPYIPAENPSASLMDKSSTLRYFVKGGPGEKLPSPRRETMFIELLESIHPKDAQLVIWAKDKQLSRKYKGITKKLVQATWDTLIKG